jgi:hypothetical protein
MKKKVVCYDKRDVARLLQFVDEDEADVIEFFLSVIPKRSCMR